MTLDQAYTILGLRPGADRIEVEQAYTASMRKLRLQMTPGMPMATRHQAPNRIPQLERAFELVKNAATPRTQPTSARRCPPPKAKPPGRHAGPPRTASPPASQPVSSVPRLVVAAGAVVVMGIVAVLIVLFSARSKAPETVSESVVPTAILEAPSTTARLRVLSVPWSYAEVDGKPLGPSGQVDAFTVRPGKHQLVLRQGNRIFPVTVSVPENHETTVYAQLEKGQVHVSHKKIQLARD